MGFAPVWVGVVSGADIATFIAARLDGNGYYYFQLLLEGSG
jgi:hypothetical protein